MLTDWTLAWRAAQFIDLLLVVAGIWRTLVGREADRRVSVDRPIQAGHQGAHRPDADSVPSRPAELPAGARRRATGRLRKSAKTSIGQPAAKIVKPGNSKPVNVAASDPLGCA
jgi:hypothetical protein